MKIISIFKMLILLSIFFSMFAVADVPDITSEEFFEPPQESVDIEQLKLDQEILESLNNFKDLPDNDIFIIEQQSIEQELTESQFQELSSDEITELEKNTPVDDLLIDDSFDDLDIDSILLEDEIIQPELIEKPEILLKQPPISENKGVGVIGEEELLINSLDKSDLMDFNKPNDVWKKNLIEEVEKIDEIEK